MRDNSFFDIGVNLAGAMRGVPAAEMRAVVAKEKVLQSADGAPFQRTLCKMAADVFEACGDGNSVHATLFRNLSQEKTWYPEYNKFSDSVLRAMSKQANPILPAALALHDKGGAGMVKNLVGGGALGGAALGSIAFLLSRNARQSSVESAQMLEKVKAFKKLKLEIEEDMHTKEIIPKAA